MSRPDDVTTRFKVDISELKSGITEANRQIRLANSEFKAATAGMDDWGNSADGVSAKLKQLESVLSSEEKKLANLKEQYRLTADFMGENSKAAQELLIKVNNQQAAVNKTSSELEKYRTRLTEINSAAEDAANGTEEFESAADKLKRTISEQESELERLKSAYASVALEQGTSSDEAEALASEIQSLSSELNENQNKLSEAERAADQFDETLEDLDNTADEAGNGFTVLKGAISDLISNAIQKGIEMMKELAASIMDAGMSFEAGMSEVAAISGASAEDMVALTEKAKEMGEATKFSAADSAEALKYMAMAGWKTNDMLGGLEGIMKLAAASGEDLGTVSDIVTDALTAFGLKASDSAHFADVLAMASSNANTNVYMMGETFKYAAPVAGALGYSIEDTATAIGLMANAGIKSSQAGTALRSTLTRLAKPPKPAAEAMDALNLSITNADGSMKPLRETMLDLREAFAGLTQQEQVEYAANLAGQEAMSGLLAIVNASEADFNKLTNAVDNAAGAADRMSAINMDNLAGDVELLNSALDTGRIAIYDGLSPALRELTQAAADFVTGIDWNSVGEKLRSALQWVIDHGQEIAGILITIGSAMTAAFVAGKIVAFATAVGKVISAFKTATTVISGIKAAMVALNITMAANPIGLVVTAIAALVAAFITLWNTSDEFKQFWIDLWENIKSVCSSAASAIGKFFTETIPESFNKFVQFLSELPNKVGEFFTTTTKKVVEWGVEIGTKAKEIGSQFLEGVVTFFKKLPEEVGYFIGYTTSEVVQWGVELGAKAKEIGSQFLETLITFFKELPSNAWNWLTQTFDKVREFGSNLIDKAVEIGTNFVDSFISFFTDLPDKMWDIGSNIIRGLWEGIKSSAGWLFDSISDFASGVIDGFKDAFDINSPSRVMRDKVGKWLPAGVAEGIDENLSLVKKSAKNMLDELSFPHFDPRYPNNKPAQANGNIVFNQYNTSPKPLSRLEIYRQTNNQLRLVRGVIG